jgi:hypothetical protein
LVSSVRTSRTLNALLASCGAFIILLVMNGVVSPVLYTPISALFGLQPYSGDWTKDVPRLDEIVLPGETITVRLQQRTLQGAYEIEHLSLALNGHPLAAQKPHTADYPNEIRYRRNEFPQLKDAGEFNFELPSNDDLLGQQATVTYSLDFAYPTQIGARSFVWTPKPLSGSFTLNVGTAEQRTLLNLLRASLGVGSVVFAGIAWVAVFAIANRTLRPEPSARA